MSVATLTTVVDEKATAVYSVVLKDENAVAVPLASLTSLILTYYDVATGAIINGRNAQNILNANNCTFGATNGTLTWTLQTTDTVNLSGVPFELHAALIKWQWAGKVGTHTVNFFVRNVEKI